MIAKLWADNAEKELFQVEDMVVSNNYWNLFHDERRRIEKPTKVVYAYIAPASRNQVVHLKGDGSMIYAVCLDRADAIKEF